MNKNRFSLAVALFVCASSLLPCALAGDATDKGRSPQASLPDALKRPLALVDVLNIAAVQNGNILQAKKDVEAAFGVAIQTRAIVLPQVVGSGQYEVIDDSLIARQTVAPQEISIPGIGTLTTPGRQSPLTNNQTWNSNIQIIQNIYEGGRLVSAVKSAKLIREFAIYDYQTVVADNLLEVCIAYDDAQVAVQQIAVREAAIKYLTEQLDITQKRFNAGVLTEFEVLRAQVELTDAQPPLIVAQNEYIVAKQRLVELLGYDLAPSVANDLPLNLTTPLQAKPYPGELSESIIQAFANRSELAALRTLEKLRTEDVVKAKAGYKPSLQGFAGYNLTSNVYSRNAGDSLNGWSAGAQVSWALFDGLLTKGKVDEAVALQGKSKLKTDETARQVQLQVRTSWDDLRRAKSVVDALGMNIEKAVESLRLATVRYEAGTVTQLDVLNAQTTLTNTRAQYFQALRDYSVARSRLERSVGANFVSHDLYSMETKRPPSAAKKKAR